MQFHKKNPIYINGDLRVLLAPHDNHCTIRDKIRYVYKSIRRLAKSIGWNLILLPSDFSKTPLHASKQ
jgi:hypothetical protein